MKKFQFRLATVQRVRQIQDDVARGELLAANHALTSAEAVTHERRAIAHMVALPDAPMSHDEFARHRFAVEAAFNAVTWAKHNERAASEVVAERRGHWIETNTRLRVVERLHDRARDEHKLNMRREEDRNSDELATARFRERITTR